MKKLVITGCGRSGTTLMNMLCGTGFKDVYQTPWEQHILKKGNLETYKREARKAGCEWVTFKKPRQIFLMDEVLAIPNVHVIYMMRDPRAVVLSKDKGGRYLQRDGLPWVIGALEALRLRNNSKVLIVKFERLIKNPNNVQVEIAEKFGLTIKRKFSECYRKFHEKSDSKSMAVAKGVRPMDLSRLQPWKDNNRKDEKRIEKVFNYCPEIKEIMKKFEYEWED